MEQSYECKCGDFEVEEKIKTSSTLFLKEKVIFETEKIRSVVELRIQGVLKMFTCDESFMSHEISRQKRKNNSEFEFRGMYPIKQHSRERNSWCLSELPIFFK